MLYIDKKCDFIKTQKLYTRNIYAKETKQQKRTKKSLNK